MEATGTPGARSASTLILGMLERGIPLTLLPDLAWPDTLVDPEHAPVRRCADPGRHAARHGRQESLQQALAYAACPTGRHRRAPAACADTGHAERG